MAVCRMQNRLGRRSSFGDVCCCNNRTYIWSFDKVQRKRERAASAKLLAQITTTPVGATQIEIAKFRCYVMPSWRSNLSGGFANDENARKDLAAQATKITIELPSQFLYKSDIFSETGNNMLANAFSQVNRLKKKSSLLRDLPDAATEDDISQHLMAVLSQIIESEQATMDAFQALLKIRKAILS